MMSLKGITLKSVMPFLFLISISVIGDFLMISLFLIILQDMFSVRVYV